MKHILALAMSVVAVVPPGCARDETGALQDRLNGYFHSEVTPKLQSCWDRLQGEGRVEVKLSFTRAAPGWAWQKAEISRSTLPREQDGAVLQCMETAARGTSFAAVESADETGFFVYWGWPVPLPSSGTTLATRMISEGGGSRNCENPSCYATTCTGNKCPTANQCSGYSECTVTDSGDGSLQCNFKNKCVSSGYFRGGGGVIMY
jgi:hypothetical protein